MVDVNTPSASPEGESELEKTQTPEVVAEEAALAKAGDKTDPNLLLKSLHEEREKRRVAEERNAVLEEQINSSDPSEPDEEVGKLKVKLAEIERKQQRSEVLELHPQLKEIWSDFEEFRTDSDNKGLSMRTAAKAFLVEKGLLEPQRKGLEKPTGGPKVPLSTGMTTEDIKHLRETDFKKYQEMVIKKQIKFN